VSRTIARGDAERRRLVHRVAGAVPHGCVLYCESDEVVLFLRHGSLLGALGAGTHHLTGDVLPFLRVAVGPELDADVVYVSTTPRDVDLGLTFSGIRDVHGSAASGHVRGVARLRAGDPMRLVLGMRSPSRFDEDLAAHLGRVVLERLPSWLSASGCSWSDVAKQVGTFPSPEEVMHAFGSDTVAPNLRVERAALWITLDPRSRETLGLRADAQSVDLPAVWRGELRAALQPGLRVSALGSDGKTYVGTLLRRSGDQGEVLWDGGGAPSWILMESLSPVRSERAIVTPPRAPAAAPVPNPSAVDVGVRPASRGTVPLAAVSATPAAPLPQPVDSAMRDASRMVPSVGASTQAAAASSAGWEPVAAAYAATLRARGQRVVAQHGDGHYYPATIQRFANGFYEVSWDNGMHAWLSPDKIR
jgi:hypothetical protein